MSTSELTPADAFSLLGHPIRVEVLSALMEADGADFEAATVSFSELYDRVAVDDSGQLNYHLSKLTDHFIEKVDEGYRFRQAGRKIVWAIQAGVFTGDRQRTFAAEGTCYECGEAALQARIANNWLRIDCSACETLHTQNPFPSGGLTNRSPDAILHAFDQIVRTRVSLASDGVCNECTGKLTPYVTDDTPTEWGVDAVIVYQCQHCGYWLTLPFGMIVVEHSLVKRFYRDHGVDLDQRPYWDLAVCVNDEHTTITSEDPWRIEVVAAMGDDQLRATLDDHGEVVDITVESHT